MLLVAFVLSLLVIAAGLKLLIHVQTLGGFLKYTTWFLISMGFFLLVLIFCMGMGKAYYHMHKMKHGHTYNMGMGHHGMHGKEGYMQGGCHGGMMPARAGSDGGGECEGEEMQGCCMGCRGGYAGKSDKEMYFWKKKWEDCYKEERKDSLQRRK